MHVWPDEGADFFFFVLFLNLNIVLSCTGNRKIWNEMHVPDKQSGWVVQSIVYSLMKWLVSNSLTLSVHMKSNDAFQIASEG